jgi:hypothetical protein
MIKALCYRPEGLRFDTRWSNYIFFLICVILSAAQGPEIYSASNRNMFLGRRARPVRRTDNLTAICEPTIWTMWDSQHITAPKAPMACYGDSFTLWRRSVLPVRYELDCKYYYK